MSYSLSFAKLSILIHFNPEHLFYAKQSILWQTIIIVANNSFYAIPFVICQNSPFYADKLIHAKQCFLFGSHIINCNIQND